jgi:hypothetical protein
VCVCEVFNFLKFLIYRVFHDCSTTSRGYSEGHSERAVRYERGYSISVVAALCLWEIKGDSRTLHCSLDLRRDILWFSVILCTLDCTVVDFSLL